MNAPSQHAARLRAIEDGAAVLSAAQRKALEPHAARLARAAVDALGIGPDHPEHFAWSRLAVAQLLGDRATVARMRNAIESIADGVGR